jgi:hypothetical protein
LALTFPLIFNAAAFLYLRQRSKLAENVIWARSLKARPVALKRLKAAEREGKSDVRRFYDQAAAAFSGYLADKFNLPGIELTGDNLERILSVCSVPSETIESTRACLQECDFERFVSASQSKQKMNELSSRIRENIEALEKTAVPSRF